MFIAHGIIKYGMKKEGKFAALAKPETLFMSGSAMRAVIAVPTSTKAKASKKSQTEP